MASDPGRSVDSLHMLLARARDAGAVIKGDRDGDAPRLAPSAAALAPYLHPRHRDRGVGASSEEETDVMDIEHELRKATETVNRTNGSRAPESEEPARYDFVSLGEKVALAMVRAAEDQVTEAQNKLKEVQAWADGLSQQVRAKDRELADMTDRIRAFGETVLEANRKFHDTVDDRRESDHP